MEKRREYELDRLRKKREEKAGPGTTFHWRRRGEGKGIKTATKKKSKAVTATRTWRRGTGAVSDPKAGGGGGHSCNREEKRKKERFQKKNQLRRTLETAK